MKPVLVLSRVIIVGLFWSIFFLEGIRIIMLQNWYFDIFNPEHWNIAWNLWLSGWVIDEPKEWAFILIILTFIPLWLTGWAALSLICWENIIGRLFIIPWQMIKKIVFKTVKIITNSSIKGVKRKNPTKKSARAALALFWTILIIRKTNQTKYGSKTCGQNDNVGRAQTIAAKPEPDREGSRNSGTGSL